MSAAVHNTSYMHALVGSIKPATAPVAELLPLSHERQLQLLSAVADAKLVRAGTVCCC